jgi:RNA polymerase sigma-70 factor (ECF subfamily)
MTTADSPTPLAVPVGTAIRDRRSFERLTEPYRRELKLHCYRMVGSLHEAEDLVQETFLRAWRARSEFEGRGSLRGWLYKIASNASLNALETRTRTRRVLLEPGTSPSRGRPAGGPANNVAWLEPYPDFDLAGIADSAPGPLARYEAKEAVQLAFVAAIQNLPPRQRAALLLCDVIGWSADETALLLGGSVAAINSALQRARATLASRYAAGRPAITPRPDPQQNALLDRYMQAWQSADLDGFVALLREDGTYRMPPWREWYQGRAAIREFFESVWSSYGGFRVVSVGANGQPAFGVYAKGRESGLWRPHSMQVLEILDGEVASLTAYVGSLGPALFPAFGLSATPPEEVRLTTN